jgi:hypothetical protein
MSAPKRTGWCIAAATVLLVGSSAQAEDIKLSSDATYLHLCSSDPGRNPTPIDLGALGISPGDMIGLEVLGDWDNTFFESGGDVHTDTWAVFSSSPLLLGGSQSHRVPGAISAGNPTTTPPGYLCNQATDIPEDFSVPSGASLLITVPPGATHLFTSVADVLFYDNTDPDSDYMLRITNPPVSVDGSSWGAVKALYQGDAVHR